MHVSIWDLAVIYLLPFGVAGVVGAVCLVCLYLIVRRDVWHLDFTYDILIGLRYRKRALTFGNVAFLFLFDNGIQAAFFYRVSRFLYLRGMASAAVIINKVAKAITNMDVPPSAKIGKGLSLWHGTSIVIAQFSDIGERFVIRQGCSVSGFGKVKVGNDVQFSPGSFVIEGNPETILIGDGAIIASNAIVTKSVPPYHVASGVPADRITRRVVSKLNGVVLDLDRMLVDAEEAILLSLNHALGTLGRHPMRVKGLAAYRDRYPMHTALRTIFGGPNQERGEELFIHHLLERCNDTIRLRAGAESVLEELTSMGMKIGVFSSQCRLVAQRMLARFQLDRFVTAYRGADDLGEWKPNPMPVTAVMEAINVRKENTVYVGTSLLDLRTGNNAAVRVIVLPLGSQTREKLVRALPPQYPDNVVLDRLEETLSYIRKANESEAPHEILSI